jgi:hypothetical protein
MNVPDRERDLNGGTNVRLFAVLAIAAIHGKVSSTLAQAKMTRVLVIVSGVCVVLLAGYLAFSKWAIRHETVALFDVARNRAVLIEITVLRDAERRAAAGLVKLPIAIISQGNTVKNTEYSSLRFSRHAVISSSASSTTCRPTLRS